MTQTPIAIIGTGMAGLAAAHTLQAAGKPVRLFDKSRGSGGRMASKRSDAGSLDIGAPYFTATHAEFCQAVDRWHALGYIARWPDTAEASSHWVGVPRMSALTRSLLGDLPVQFSCQIARLERTDKLWYLIDANNLRHGPFSQVIIAVPAPQATPLLAVAPTLAALSGSISMAPVWAVALTFQKPLELPPLVHPEANARLAAIYCNSSKPQRSAQPQTWVLQAHAKWSRVHQNDTPGQVIASLCEAFEQVYGDTLPTLGLSVAHRWLYSQPVTEQSWGALSAPELGVYACGDWCLTGDVQGAWLSGCRAAEMLLKQPRKQP